MTLIIGECLGSPEQNQRIKSHHHHHVIRGLFTKTVTNHTKGLKIIKTTTLVYEESYEINISKSIENNSLRISSGLHDYR